MSHQRKMVFVRHGEYDPESDLVELTSKGHVQARQAGKNLLSLGFQGAAVVASPRTRAAQTAENIASEIDSNAPILSENIFGASMSPGTVADLDAVIEQVAAENGIESGAPLVIVSHAELLSQLPGNKKAIAQVAFCEVVEYQPGTWRQPLPGWHKQ